MIYLTRERRLRNPHGTPCRARNGLLRQGCGDGRGGGEGGGDRQPPACSSIAPVYRLFIAGDKQRDRWHTTGSEPARSLIRDSPVSVTPPVGRRTENATGRRPKRLGIAEDVACGRVTGNYETIP